MIAIVLVGLACGPMPPVFEPTDAETARYASAVSDLKPGAPESLVGERFPPPKPGETCVYTIVDVDEYRAEGYLKRTYWIGYLHSSRLAATVETKRVIAITAINGKIDSTYRP